MTIVEAAQSLRNGSVSSVELTTFALAAIEKQNPALNAFLTVTGEFALAQARQADAAFAAGNDAGPLQGIPIALKDVFCTKGIRTTCGSKLFETYVPDFDSAVAEKLYAAGAVMVGKTGMHELAYGITSNNPHFGAVRNPWNTNCVPGGSSGGSGSAVAAGLCFMAMGSDTGGSIRIPASFCGTVGIKPTSGRVSRYGVLPLDYTLDHMGPLTRSSRDAGIVLNALAGFDHRDDTSSRRPVDNYDPGPAPSIKGLLIGLPTNYYNERVSPEVTAALKAMSAAAESLGAIVEPVTVPDIVGLNATGRTILLSEAPAALEPFLHRRSDFGADVLALLDQGRLLPATGYINAQRLRRLYIDDFHKLFRSIECLFTPTSPIPAPEIGQSTVDIDGTPEDTRLASTRFVRAINVIGFPAVSTPCGLSSSGLPLGLQIIGRPFEEALILKVASALENEKGFHLQSPARS